MTAAIIVAVMGWLLAAAMWVRANGEEDRADRAKAFAQRALNRLAAVSDQRDRYCGLYHEAVARNAALLDHIGDEREAQVVQALADQPAFYAAKAAREAASIDREWLDLDSGLS